ncbi:hypothetical protein DQ237_02090 [Blastococcus sp. TF02-8]|uniref:hypothetical protein n=1 Tax=Blastococcus sp. TF02-8 TaxID=2250574 RepID=UPI000DE9D0D2|nr:hypothetical protein [Blastococcus sp. TF02-8]RBY97733.1 hypothetical protein DQ237_02090 [Blastococcus sp. TF02-8]
MSAPSDVDVDVPAQPPSRSGAAVLQVRIDRDTVLPALATVLVVVHLVLRGWTAAGGWLTGPDFLAAAVAAGQRVDIAGPPGAAALAHGVAAIAPLSWPALIGLELLGQLLVDLALYRLLVGLFGRRPAVLLPLTVYVASSLTLVGGVWWSAALVQIPVQLALLTALDAHVQHLRTGARAKLVTSAVAVAVGVLFAVEFALVPLLLLAGTALWATAGPARDRVRPLARWWPAWAALVAAAVGGVGLRLLAGGSLLDADALAPALRELPGTLTRTVLPGLVGGPWNWAPALTPLATADPRAGLVWGAGVVAAVVVLAAVALRRGALRAWLVAVAACAVLLLAGAAATDSGPAEVPAGLVPPATVAVVAALALALAYLPVRSAPPVLRRRAWTVRGAGSRLVGRLPRTGGAVAVAAALLVGSVLSAAEFREFWSVNTADRYVDNAAAALVGRTDLVVADAPVPEDVVPSALEPANRTSVVLAGLPRLPPFLVEGQVVGELVTLDGLGNPQLAVVDPVTSSATGPDPGCGWLAADGPARIRLPRATGAGRWLVQISYFSGARNGVRVTAGDTLGAGAAEEGAHNLFVQVSGQVREVELAITDTGSPLCVTAVSVGQAAPLGGS